MRFVVTAGPTREPLDPVRFISNRSSGKMGYAIAEAAIADGHDVTLISGPVCLRAPSHAKVVTITTASELHDALLECTNECDVLVMCAAVADYKPVSVASRKMAKPREKFTIEFEPATDVLSAISKSPRDFFVVGFAAETHDIEARAQQKLRAKNCDMIVANDVSRNEIGIGADENEVVIIARDGDLRRIARAEKKIIARELVKIICTEAKKVLTKKSR